LLGSFLSPIYWLLAYRYRVPGLKFRGECVLLAFRLLLCGKAPRSLQDIYNVLLWPMDSTRYFEFAFAWDVLSDLSASRYLDVSSPRLFPIILTLRNNTLVTELINPDLDDLSCTANFVKALGLEKRCNLHCHLISAVPFDSGSFDVVTSISVVEHIPQDTQAIHKMWNLLKPKGRLLLTLPCAAQASEQYINRNEYGLLAHNEGGYFFFQRLYDQASLEERIFSITGQPRRHAVYGEKLPGTLRRNLDRKMGDPSYPYWREPYMMGQDFRCFNDLSELPGEGVIAMEFEKK
jgi:SAM-dependent methyltransferase